MAHIPQHPHTPAPPFVVRSARRVRLLFHNPTVLSWLSWVLWFAAVAGFAAWTLLYYRAPAKPAWVGMTIRTTVFAIWALILREWAALRFARATQPPMEAGPEEGDWKD